MAITGRKSGLQRAPVGHPSHHRRRRHVAQNVNDENVHRDGRGANMGAHRIDHRRIQRRSIQQQKESRQRDRRHHDRPFANSATIMTGTPSAMLAPKPGSRNLSSAAADSRPATRRPVRPRCPSTTMMMPKIKLARAASSGARCRETAASRPEFRPAKTSSPPCPESPSERRIARQTEECPALRSFLERIELSALRFLEKQHRNRQQESRSRRNVERKAPSIVRGQIAAQQISRRRSHRNRQIETRRGCVRAFPPRNRSATKVGAMVTNVASPIPPACAESAVPCRCG
jgi:hypothetical protein